MAAGSAAGLQGVQPDKQKRVRSATARLSGTSEPVVQQSWLYRLRRLMLQAIRQTRKFKISELRWRARGSCARSAASAAQGQARNATAEI